MLNWTTVNLSGIFVFVEEFPITDPVDKNQFLSVNHHSSLFTLRSLQQATAH